MLCILYAIVACSVTLELVRVWTVISPVTSEFIFVRWGEAGVGRLLNGATLKCQNTGNDFPDLAGVFKKDSRLLSLQTSSSLERENKCFLFFGFQLLLLLTVFVGCCKGTPPPRTYIIILRTLHWVSQSESRQTRTHNNNSCGCSSSTS